MEMPVYPGESVFLLILVTIFPSFLTSNIFKNGNFPFFSNSKNPLRRFEKSEGPSAPFNSLKSTCSRLHAHVNCFARSCISMCVRMCMRVCVRVYACLRMCVCPRARTCVYACMHTRACVFKI